MKDLIILEWKKFKSNAVFSVLGLSYLLLSPFVILAGRNLFKNMPPPMPSSQAFYEFPTVWDYQGYVGNWLIPFCLGFLVIYMFTSEVSNKTLRQNILTGMTKKDFFVGKLAIIIILALISTFIYLISSLIIGVVNTDGYDFALIFDNNWAILRYFLLNIGYMSFAFMLAVLIRNGTLAILLYFLYVMMIEPILMLVHAYYFTNSSRNYWPMNSIEDLMPFPLYKIPGYFIQKQWDFEILLSYQTAILMAILYSSVFIYIAYRSFLKNDI